MPIDLTKFERGVPFAGDYAEALTALQERLAQLQLAQIVHRKRAIIIFEGWEGAGKKAALKRLVAAWDPCHLATHCFASDDGEHDERHWLARFWSRLPPAGHSTIFFRSWYRQLVDRRVAGDLDEKGWSRAADEVNEFESQQRDHGTLVIKLFFHLDEAVQAERLRERREDPWQRWLVGPGDVRSLAARDGHQTAWQSLFALTDTRWAPWRIIDCTDKRASRLATLSAVADALEKALPLKPPVEGDTVVSINSRSRSA